MAALTKFFIEDPTQRAPARLTKRAPLFAFAASGMVLIVLATSVGTVALYRANEAFASNIEAAKSDGCFGAAAMAKANECDSPFAVTDTVNPEFSADDVYWRAGVLAAQTCKRPEGTLVRQCEFGNTSDPDLTIALVGDSHAEHVIDPFAVAAANRDWRLIPFARPRCSGLESAADIATIVKEAPELREDATDCLAWGAEVLEQLLSRDDIDLVVYGNYYNTTVIPAQQAVDRWNEVREAGKIVVAMTNLPGQRNVEGTPSGPECVEAHKDDYDPCAWEMEDSTDHMKSAAVLGEVPTIDLTDYLCTEDNTCHTVIGGTIVYFDRHHLTYTFAATLAPYIGEALDSIVAND